MGLLSASSMSNEENSTDRSIAKDDKENLKDGQRIQRIQYFSEITFHSLLPDLFSSWGSTSKKVMYKKVPPAIP